MHCWVLVSTRSMDTEPSVLCALQENAPSVRSHSGTLVLGLRTPQAPPPLFMSQVRVCHGIPFLYL